MLTRYLHACFSDFYRGCYYSILPTAAAISLFYYKKVEQTFKWICALIILTCISELIAKYVGMRYHENGIVYNIFTPVEYFMYAMIYSKFLNSKKWRTILRITILCLLFLGIINIIFFQPTRDSPTNTMTIESVLLVFLSLLLFINIREKPVYENIVMEGVFWFNSAILFYYSFDILIWGFYEVMYHMKDPPNINSNMLLLSSGLLYVVFAFSIVLNYYSVNKLTLKNV
jgi:hypothetical protein